MQYSSTIRSPVGRLTLASDGKNLSGLWIEGQKYFGAALGKSGKSNGALQALPLFSKVEEWLEQYFAGKRPRLNFSLAPVGSEFRQRVWNILGEIPYGQTVTYGEIAKQLGGCKGKKPMSAQAVGGAVGHNPISIIIPCHRVVGADGSLTGYAGGLKVKMALLQLEGVDMERLYVPQKGTAL